MPYPLSGISATSGQQCPETGLWCVAGRPDTAIPINQGDIVPPFAGRVAMWTLSGSGEACEPETGGPRTPA
jgi:hypothetical protein